MKGQSLLLGISLVLILAMNAQAQAIDEGYSIATWKDFKTAAITYTFDDNEPNQLAVVVPLFNEFNFDVTLFVITDVDWSPIDWDGLAEAAKDGHEIASHTVTHPNFGDITIEQQNAELESSKNAINEHISGQSALTLAYPYCVTGNFDLVKEHYIAARGCQGQVASISPTDMYNITSIIVGEEGTIKSTEALNSRSENALINKGWAIFLLHGIDGDGGYSDISSSSIRGNLEYLEANQDKFWVDTFSSVSKYIRERNDASVTELSISESIIELEVTDSLDNTVYDEPITIERILPEGWDSVSVTQDSELLETIIIVKDGLKYIHFNTVPDSGVIILENVLSVISE